jgi:acylphosphatase
MRSDLRGENAAPPEARRYLVKGRVQGVGYRWYVEREANLLGLRGWVRNNLDGAVEVLAIGGREQLATLRRKLQEGPRASRVDTVEELPAQASPDIKSFRIEGAW